jgi:feruloyl-CoA synthase
MPGLVDKTIANLREIAPTIYFNVPRGFDMLLPALEQDSELRKNFFSRLQMIFYAAAAFRRTFGKGWSKCRSRSGASAWSWFRPGDQPKPRR